MPNYTPVRIGPNPPQGLPVPAAFTGGEQIPMDQPTGAIPPWLTCKASLTSLATWFGTSGGLISSIVGTANEIAVSTVAGVATLSFPTNGLVYSPAAGSVGFLIHAAAGSFGMEVISNNAAGTSDGLYVQAGTNNTDFNSYFVNSTGGTLFGAIIGDGGLVWGGLAGSVSRGVGTMTLSTTGVGTAIRVEAGALAGGAAAFQADNSSGASLYNAGALNATLTMNSTGANYGTIGNVTPQVWGLGSANNIGPMSTGGTVALQWGASGGITIPTPIISTNALTVNGAAGSYTAQFNGSSTTGSSYGPIIEAGTNSSDEAFLVYSQNSSSLFFQIRGDGFMAINNNGMTIANISGTAIPLVVDAPVGNWGVEVIGSSTAGSSYGLLIEAGTGTGDYALYVGSQANAHQLFQVRGDGSINCYNPTGGFLGAGTINVSGGYYINGVAIVSTGTFTATFACGGASPTGTAHYSVAGNSVTITWPAVLGAGGGTALSISGIPAAIQPARAQFVPLGSSVVENGGIIPAGGGCFDMLFNASSGTVNIYLAGSSSAFAGATNRGFANAVSTTYQLS